MTSERRRFRSPLGIILPAAILVVAVVVLALRKGALLGVGTPEQEQAARDATDTKLPRLPALNLTMYTGELTIDRRITLDREGKAIDTMLYGKKEEWDDVIEWRVDARCPARTLAGLMKQFESAQIHQFSGAEPNRGPLIFDSPMYGAQRPYVKNEAECVIERQAAEKFRAKAWRVASRRGVPPLVTLAATSFEKAVASALERLGSMEFDRFGLSYGEPLDSEAGNLLMRLAGVLQDIHNRNMNFRGVHFREHEGQIIVMIEDISVIK